MNVIERAIKNAQDADQRVGWLQQAGDYKGARAEAQVAAGLWDVVDKLRASQASI